MQPQTTRSVHLSTRWTLTACTAVFFVLAAVPLAAQSQITMEAERLDLAPPQGPRAPLSVAGLDCDSPATPGANVCLRVTCDPCMETIPDLGTVTLGATLAAGDLQNLLGTSSCTIRDVNVAVELAHSFVGDLVVEFGRGATQGSIYFPPGSCPATGVDALFNDESSRAPDACPATGGLSYRPTNPLSVYDFLPAAGTYALVVRDVLSGDTGMTQRWGFSLALDCDLPPQTGCVENDTTLCLNNDRFQVRAVWTTANSNSGAGRAEELTDDTGYFWFFRDTNVEMVVKVLNGCPVNQRFWVFAGGLTNVEVEMTVVDTERGVSQLYRNPQSTPFQPIQDTGAFATCP